MALQVNGTTKQPRLYVSFELSASRWVLTFTDGAGLRLKGVDAGDIEGVKKEVETARRKFGLSADCPVHSCFEAGRDGFWLHRWLVGQGIENVVVDPSSIEVNRRARQVKTDRIDGEKLAAQLVRYVGGDRRALHPLRVPTAEAEDARRPERELHRLKQERTAHANRIRSLLVLHGIRLELESGMSVEQFRKRAVGLKTPTGESLPSAIEEEIVREYERLFFVQAQIRDLSSEMAKWRRESKHPWAQKMRRLSELKGIDAGSDVLVREFFWRDFKNRKEVGSAGGLAPVPFQSGNMGRQQGISKAGHPRVRSLMVELSWLWLRYQPRSRETIWYQERFGKTGKRSRRVGIVALARRLLIALWRWIDQGVVPEGAILKRSEAGA